jgi:hypothetical protein
VFSEKLGWQPIDTAPIDKDVMLIVTDGHGEPYAVFKPFRLTAAGWVSSEKERRSRSRQFGRPWSPTAWPAVHTPQNKALTHRILGPQVCRPLFLIPSEVLYARGMQSCLIHRTDLTVS